MPRQPVTPPPECKHCKGKGHVPSRLPGRDKPCEYCGGKGFREPKPMMYRRGTRRR